MAAPTPPTPPRLPRKRLKFAPVRPLESLALDGATVKPRGGALTMAPPFTPWNVFLPWFQTEWAQGEHVALVARSQSGKTTLARQILGIRSNVIVLATKVKDDALYRPLQELGYELVTTFDASNLSKPRVIFKPPLPDPSRASIKKQADAFREALVDIFLTGGWTIYADELRYLSQVLGLQDEIDTLYLQGSSLGVTMVAATQRPVSVPLNMFQQASKVFLWRINDRDDRRRASEYLGPNSGMAFEVIDSLPRYEALYVDVVSDLTTRTRVDLRAT